MGKKIGEGLESDLVEKDKGWITLNGSLKIMILFTLIIMSVRVLFIFPITINGHSMDDTLRSGEKYLVNKVKEVEKLDIVVFNAPDGENKYIKRVIGVEGDWIKYKDDGLYVNHVRVEEPYLEGKKKYLKRGDKLTEDINRIEIGKGEYFVLGDNRRKSHDSRYFGTIDEEDILGVLIKKKVE